MADLQKIVDDLSSLTVLEAAELSAMLEDEFGSDPFSAGGYLPEKVGDLLAFYSPVPT